MTREEAIEFGNMWLQINEDCKDSNTYVFFQMAIKALEQKPILDKIRAEIKQLPTSTCTETCRIRIDADDFKENVLVIIDKYKAESEGRIW